MEKEQVKAALNNCIGVKPCKDCPYEKGFLNFPACAVEMMKDALVIIEQLEQSTNDTPGRAV